jgi:hypothetical protein
LFGLIYLFHGQAFSLQRDYIGIIPIALTLLLIPAKGETAVNIFRFAIAGFLFGIAFLIKPHLIIGLPIIFGTLLITRRMSVKKSGRDFIHCLMTLILFFLLPVAATGVWLAAHSALGHFINIFFQYLPLHSSITGAHITVTGFQYIFYLFDQTLQFQGYGALILCSLFAFYRLTTITQISKPLIYSSVCLLSLTLLYSIYPTLAGKFWRYHYMPFIFFCSISTTLCLYIWPYLPVSEKQWQIRELLIILVFFITIVIHLNLPWNCSSLVRNLKSESDIYSPKRGRVDEISAWLKTRLNENDTVQPLDWTGGSIHAMLLAKAKLSTRFMYEYHFYHHVSLPYIQELRKSFINQLYQKIPRFIIEIHTINPRVSGVDSSQEFPELRNFINNNYLVALKGDGYLIYEYIKEIKSEFSGTNSFKIK